MASTAAQQQIFHALDGQNNPIADAMRYAVQGGKGLRAFLVIESARLHGANEDSAITCAAAIEALHAYSLIHDDLPSMDNDDLRRGQPTVHRKWNEATAILAGDALQTLSFELLTSIDAPRDLINSFAKAAGIAGMVGGQALDIAAETAQVPLSLDQIITLQKGKTGALIEWSATAGARLTGSDTTALQTFGENLGLAFQIWDDVLDVTGDAAQVGKAVGKDADAGKATFVSLLGLPEAKSRAALLIQQACDILSVYGKTADKLRAAAWFTIEREK